MIKDSFQSADGLKLYTQHWPLDDPQAFVLLVHGFGEHIGRYNYVAEALNAAGYAAIGLDHRGHGQSEGQPRASVRSMSLYVDDLVLLWEKARAAYPHKPCFVLGHSLGAQISLGFTLRHQAKLQGLILSGIPVYLIDKLLNLSRPLLSLGGKIIPALPVMPAIDSALLSHDPAINAAYDADPLVYHAKVSFGMVAAVLANERQNHAQLPNLRLPMLVMHGEADQITNPQGSRDIYALSGSADKSLQILPDLYHEILNETTKDELISTVIAWLNAHLPA